MRASSRRARNGERGTYSGVRHGGTHTETQRSNDGAGGRSKQEGGQARLRPQRRVHLGGNLLRTELSSHRALKKSEQTLCGSFRRYTMSQQGSPTIQGNRTANFRYRHRTSAREDLVVVVHEQARTDPFGGRRFFVDSARQRSNPEASRRASWLPSGRRYRSRHPSSVKRDARPRDRSEYKCKALRNEDGAGGTARRGSDSSGQQRTGLPYYMAAV